MVGVHPPFRRLGFGRRLCERFFLTAQMHGRRWVRFVSTSFGSSIAFHRAVGFVPLHGDAVIDDLPVRRDYAGAGGQRVVFRRGIVHDAPAAEAGAAPGAEMGLKEALTSQVRRERPLRRGRLRRLSRRSRTAGPSRRREAPGGRGSCSRSWDSRWLRSAPFPGGRPWAIPRCTPHRRAGRSGPNAPGWPKTGRRQSVSLTPARSAPATGGLGVPSWPVARGDATDSAGASL